MCVFCQAAFDGKSPQELESKIDYSANDQSYSSNPLYQTGNINY
ncbi:MAG TPA: hypothetical protein VI564_06125 [Candidatus Nanoarchaeia archaeon]|nr:hypothetical protein [Candidatus Nanoarchaeia archaeon]